MIDLISDLPNLYNQIGNGFPGSTNNNIRHNIAFMKPMKNQAKG